MVLRTRWTAGPAADMAGPALVSVTDFQVAHRGDLPDIYRAGLGLRRAWPQMAGAVGLWLWTRPWLGRCGAVSIWQDEEAMYRFVALPGHVRIMRRYRERGAARSVLWTDVWPNRDAIWRRARLHLAGVEIPGDASR